MNFSAKKSVYIMTCCVFFLLAKINNSYAQEQAIVFLDDCMNSPHNKIPLSDFIECTRDTFQFNIHDRAKEHCIPLQYVGPHLGHSYFRFYVRQVLNSDDRVVRLFKTQYGDIQDDSSRYSYYIIMSSILENFRREKHKQHANGFIVLPSRSFFSTLVSQYSLSDVMQFATGNGIDRAGIGVKLEKIEYGEMDASSQATIEKYGLEFVPWNLVYDYCINNNIEVHSSLLGDNENGKSMHRYRTGLELRREGFETLKRIHDLIIADFGKSLITIAGGKEAGHAKNYAISNSKADFGRPLSPNDDYLVNKSHEMGTCVDFALQGEDGLVLLDRLISHSTNKHERTFDKRMHFSYEGCEFSRMCHGAIPMGVHIHARLLWK